MLYICYIWETDTDTLLFTRVSVLLLGFTLVFIREQNSPPQNVSLECRLYWAKNNQNTLQDIFYFTLNCLKEFRYRAYSQNKPIFRDICREYGLRVVVVTQQSLEIRVCYVLSLPTPVNICLSNIYFSMSMWIAFLPFEAPSHCLQHPPLFLAETAT